MSHKQTVARQARPAQVPDTLIGPLLIPMPGPPTLIQGVYLCRFFSPSPRWRSCSSGCCPITGSWRPRPNIGAAVSPTPTTSPTTASVIRPIWWAGEVPLLRKRWCPHHPDPVPLRQSGAARIKGGGQAHPAVFAQLRYPRPAQAGSGLPENGQNSDVYYARLRSKLKLVLLECRESFENCFCVSMDSNETRDYAAAIRLSDEGARIEVKDPSCSATLPSWASPTTSPRSLSRAIRSRCAP